MHAACAAIDADKVLALQKPSGGFFLFTCEKCLNQSNITSSKVLSNNVSVQRSSFLTIQTTQTNLEYSQSPHTDEEGLTTDHIPERRVCKFHIRRGCRKAENCTFLHICLDYFKGICRDDCCILLHRSLCKKFAHGLCFMNCCPNVHLTSPRRTKLRSNTELRSSKNGEQKIPPLLKHGCQRQQFTFPLMSLKLKPPVLNQPMQISPPPLIPTTPRENLEKLARTNICQPSDNISGTNNQPVWNFKEIKDSPTFKEIKDSNHVFRVSQLGTDSMCWQGDSRPQCKALLSSLYVSENTIIKCPVTYEQIRRG